jgi:hypothetical protein
VPSLKCKCEKVELKGDIYEVESGYHSKKGRYMNSGRGILELYGLVPPKRLPSVVGDNNNLKECTKIKQLVE